DERHRCLREFSAEEDRERLFLQTHLYPGGDGVCTKGNARRKDDALKIRYKIMLLFTLLVTAIISLLTGSVYYFAKLERKQVFEKRLKARATYNMQVYTALGDSAFRFLRRMDSASVVGTVPSRSIAIFSDDGRSLYRFDIPGSSDMTLTTEQLTDVKRTGEIFFSHKNLEVVA